jgi:uncharacterized protein YjbJ (UPF0337 family)
LGSGAEFGRSPWTADNPALLGRKDHAACVLEGCRVHANGTRKRFGPAGPTKPNFQHTQGERFLSSTSDRIKGYANEAAGTLKQGVGKAVGNDRLRAKGAAQKMKGEAQRALGHAKGAIKDAADKVADKAHEKL